MLECTIDKLESTLTFIMILFIYRTEYEYITMYVTGSNFLTQIIS